MPIPTLPEANNPNTLLPEVKEGVVPEKDNAALLADKVSTPDTAKVEVLTAPRLVNPVTFNPDNAPYPVIDPPTPTLPLTFNDDPIPKNPDIYPVPATCKL